MKIDFLQSESIEGTTLRLLAAYRKAYPGATMLPVPVEEIAECYLELDFDFEDLQSTLQTRYGLRSRSYVSTSRSTPVFTHSKKADTASQWRMRWGTGSCTAGTS